MTDGSTPGTEVAPGTPDRDASPDADALEEVRDALEGAAERPVDEQVATFERANEVLSAELAALDEV